jgi:GxxExxY protein
MNESLIEEELTKKIIGAAIEVHRYWGPGLIESIYEKSLAVELEMRAIPFKRQWNQASRPVILSRSLLRVSVPPW